MASNALLVLWAGGWAECVDDAAIGSTWRQENLLDLGALQSFDEVQRWGADQLAIFGDEREQVTAQHAVTSDDDAPFAAYDVCDVITAAGVAEQVVALTVEEDDDGVLTATPELHDVVLLNDESFAQQLKKLSDGAMAGHSVVATPLSQQQGTSGPECCPPAVDTGGGGGSGIMPELIAHFGDFWSNPSFPGELTITQTFEIEAGGAGNEIFAWALFDLAHAPPAITGLTGATLIADMTGASWRARLYRATRSGAALTIDVTEEVESYGQVTCFEIVGSTVSSTISTFNASGTSEHDFASSADGALLFGFTDNSYPPDGFMTLVHVDRVWPSTDDSTVLYGSRVSGETTVGLQAVTGLLEWVAKIDVGFAP